MAPMSTGRTPDTFQETWLLSRLTLPERYAHGHYLTAGRVAAWLGKPHNTVSRWRVRNQFPKPAGRAHTSGRYKVRHGWCPREVLAWLRRTGRLVESPRPGRGKAGPLRQGGCIVTGTSPPARLTAPSLVTPTQSS